jgi:DNA-binding beta-propeller fold protein YncE
MMSSWQGRPARLRVPLVVTPMMLLLIVLGAWCALAAGTASALSPDLDHPVDLAYSDATLFASNFVGASAAQVATTVDGGAQADPLTGCPQPEGIAVDSGRTDVWVACYGSGSAGQVAVMTPAGAFVRSLRLVASGKTAPSGVALDGTSGHVVVADTGTSKLYTVSATGVIGSAALPSGALPGNVAYAKVGTARFDYVADPGTGRSAS